MNTRSVFSLLVGQCERLTHAAQRLTPQQLLRVSVAVALTTIVLKTLAWWMTDSVGLLSDALEAFVNLAGASFALAMVTLAARPADAQHPYGHHKAEYFSSGFEGVLIVGAGVAIAWAALLRWWHPQPLEQLGWGLALSLLSTALNAALAAAMWHSARQHRSLALEADAQHLLTDVWTSLGVGLGLLAVDATGWQWLDPLVALAVALNITREGARLLWQAVQGLMDQALPAHQLMQIEAVLQQHSRAHTEPIRFDSLTSRCAGARSYVQLHMHAPAAWTLGHTAEVRAAVEADLMATVSGLHATIEVLPQGTQTVFERHTALG